MKLKQQDPGFAEKLENLGEEKVAAMVHVGEFGVENTKARQWLLEKGNERLAQSESRADRAVAAAERSAAASEKAAIASEAAVSAATSTARWTMLAALVALLAAFVSAVGIWFGK